MVDLEPGWFKELAAEFDRPYMHELKSFLKSELEQGKIIYPHGSEIFSAFKETPFERVKVVIIGQDPYHGPGQAHGMCFSVKPGVKAPPSLVNIFTELRSDVGVETPSNGYLGHWASQGVLLLNSVLTVEKGMAGSHHKKGWEQFTDKVIEVLNAHKENLVFILWGGPAQKKAAKVDSKRHLVLKSVHPSPLSSYRGFFGSKPFSKANAYLVKHGKDAIDWDLNTHTELSAN